MRKIAVVAISFVVASILGFGQAGAALWNPTVPTTVPVKVRVPGRYHFRWALLMSPDPSFTYESWSEAMDTAQPKKVLKSRKLSHDLGSIEPLAPELFSQRLWVEVSRYSPATGTWIPCSERVPLSVAPYALYSETTGHKYAGVAVVARSGGDYTSPTQAMVSTGQWCGVPSASNRCLLRIMPGEYHLGYGTYVGIAMKEYVDIEGSGEGVTVLWNSVDSSLYGIIFGANNAELRSLTVENRGAGTYKTAISNSGVSPSYSNVTVRATGDGSAIRAVGIVNSSASPRLREVTVEATGATNTWGITNYTAGVVRIDHSVVTAATCTVNNGSGVTTYVAGTRLENGTVCNAGTVVCAGVTDEAYAFYPGTCP